MKQFEKTSFYALTFLLVLGSALLGTQVIAQDQEEDKEAPKFSYEDVIRTSKIMQKINEAYVEEISSQDLLNASVEGMRNVLDPHTAYLPPKDYSDLQVSTKGAFGGLGITIAIRDNILTIISPLQGTPAFRMGLQAGDKIVEIENVSTEGITVEKAVEKLRGKPGTKVTIKVVREGLVEPLEFTVTRDRIKIESVPFAGFVEESIGYIKVTQFSQRTGRDLKNKIVELKEQGMKGLILDLRNNPGGLLDQSIDVSSLFLGDNQLVVFTQGRVRGMNRKFYSQNKAVWGEDKPLVILINGGSASASEIVAGAVQDHDRGVLLGKTTFGKGSVQSIFPLDSEDHSLKLTTAYYYTPSGRCINKPENAVRYKEGSSRRDYSESKEEEEDKEKLKKFETDKGRIVLEGGGVSPDVELEGNLINRYLRELERKTMFFKYVVKHRGDIEKQGPINLDYQVSPQMLADFKTYIYSDTSFAKYKSASQLMLEEFEKVLKKEQDVSGDTLESAMNAKLSLAQQNLESALREKNNTLFEYNKEYIKDALKRELLQAVLGDSVRTVSELARDIQVQEAITYLKDEKKYADALSIKKETKTQD
jgi:carboxyl-terminal processing protease